MTVPPHSLTSTAGRLRAYQNLAFKDHGVLRLAFHNAHQISPEMWRANQPWPHHVAAWARKGIKTIVNLRGGVGTGYHALELEACQRHGIELIDFNVDGHAVTSRAIPRAIQIKGAKTLFESLTYPAMMHCKSGADRAGVMAALYCHFRLGQPIEDARRQLSAKYLHIRAGKTGVLDYLFDVYLARIAPTGQSFYDWTQSPDFDHDALKAEFQANWWVTWLTDKILRRE